MKQSRESAIGSKTTHSPLVYFKTASAFARDFLIAWAVLVAVAYFILPDFNRFLYTAAVVTAAFIWLFFLIGKRRRRDLDEIKKAMTEIREDLYGLPEEIHLNKNLSDLEEDIRKTFRKMRDNIESLEKLEKMRTEFLANVSHELKTPIFAIGGYLETLLNGAIHDSNVNQHFLQKAYDHTNSLSNLLNDLIDLSMIESGEMRMSFRYFNLYDYMKAIAEEFQPMAESKGLELVVHPMREGLQIFGDKSRLRQVMSNLIQNAIKYTEQGKIEIFAEEQGKMCQISVKDTGIGIPETHIPRLFERFYRVDKARSRSVGGTGLGLAIVKHILESHGSSISVNSEEGAGSEFSFKIKK